MANYYEETKIDPKQFVPPSSRYADSKVIYYTEKKLLSFNTYKKTPIPTSASDKYAVITPGVEYRPDLVSQKSYGTVDFWWKILEANNMKDVWEFKSGVNIRIPNSFF
ncbi:MAG: hypothetical protein EKK64_05785 [Neisseriaceae bacterium]|nr:MAG: hypothetical protein EKK64_05785 [Neisseriaceae bacterium]